jgi:NhaP-type Na+/H+ and K+/H+ antiporter
MSPSEVMRAALHHAHALILLAGVLGILSVVAGLISRRIGAPMLLAFLGLGLLAGQDGVLGLTFNDFPAAYLIGSVALAVILFEGGLKTPLATLRLAFGPAAVLATLGVVITAGVGGVGIAWLDQVGWAAALLAGAVVAPTDAAAVAVLLRGAGAAVPERLLAVLEVESGLNDPVSVLLTFLLLRLFVGAAPVSPGALVLDVAREMLGGAAIGITGGWLLALALRRLRMEPALAMVLALAGALGIFGLAQLLGTSGFLATYLAGVLAGAGGTALRQRLEPFFDGLGWLAQIVLFVMLGLLIRPDTLPAFIPSALLGTAVLIFVARPVAVFACLPPFGFSLRETVFAAWVGLRGAVPIYLSLLPELAEHRGRDQRLLASIFIAVTASLVVQGWTIAPAARLLGFGRRGPAAAGK